MKRFTFIFIAICFIGCSQEQTEINTSPHVDIAEFVRLEIMWLETNSIDLVKRKRWQDVTEQDTVRVEKWSDELYPFVEIDIKPTVWKTDFMLTDSVQMESETIKTYQTTNDKQQIKEFEVVTNSKTSRIIRFNAELQDNNKLTSANQHISITSHVGYSIAGNRSTKVIGEETYQLVGHYLRTKK